MLNIQSPRNAMVALSWAFLVVTLVVPLNVFAENPQQPEAHEHGRGELNVVVEEEDVEIEMISPAENIIGFEHRPETADQKRLLKDAVETLNNLNALFSMNPEAGCKFEESEIDSGLPQGDGSGGHAEFRALYEFECSNLDKLEYMDVNIFAKFPGMQKIDARVAGPSGQSVIELTAEANRIEF